MQVVVAGWALNNTFKEWIIHKLIEWKCERIKHTCLILKKGLKKRGKGTNQMKDGEIKNMATWAIWTRSYLHYTKCK